MKTKKILPLLIFSAFSLLISCKDAGEITAIDGINVNVKNSPSVANVKNSLSFSVKGEMYNAALEYNVSFEKTEFDMALAITNLTAGSITIQVYNSTKQMLYTRDFPDKISLAQTVTLEEFPTKIKFIFNNFTGDFSSAMSVK